MTTDLGDGVTLVAREEWAQGRAVLPTGSRDPRKISEFIVHHTGGVTLGDPDPYQWARNIYDYHVHQLLYAAEAYEAFVAVYQGRALILEGRPIGCVSAATYEHNEFGYAACYLRANGDIDTDGTVLTQAKTAYRKLAQITAWNIGHQPVGTDHRRCKGDSTFCPGNDLDEWVQAGGLWVPFGSAGKPANPIPSPAPIWPAFPGTLLRFGMTSDLVKLWQARMDKLGGHLGVTGQFDQATLDTTRWFQGEHGLTTDGIVGPKTWAAAG